MNLHSTILASLISPSAGQVLKVYHGQTKPRNSPPAPEPSVTHLHTVKKSTQEMLGQT
jgi:hypothetical protein